MISVSVILNNSEKNLTSPPEAEGSIFESEAGHVNYFDISSRKQAVWSLGDKSLRCHRDIAVVPLRLPCFFLIAITLRGGSLILI